MAALSRILLGPDNSIELDEEHVLNIIDYQYIVPEAGSSFMFVLMLEWMSHKDLLGLKSPTNIFV